MDVANQVRTVLLAYPPLRYFDYSTEKFFDYIMSYSPIDNIQHGATYPSCLITGGLHDPRVQVSQLVDIHLSLIACHN